MADGADDQMLPRGRPRKQRHDQRRDHALASLANLDVWLMVESKLKGLSRRSVKRACELIAEEARSTRDNAPKVVREQLEKEQKYLFNPDTLRRCYARADALRLQDPSVADFCEKELARLGPWEGSLQQMKLSKLIP